MKPFCVDLYCGLGGWADGFMAEGYDVIGFDIERHDYGTGVYPGQLVLQDAFTVHGSQFRNAACIVASPPCQEYSYMAMPWKLAKAKAVAIRADEGGAAMAKLTALFDACFRIQREASEAAGRHIPLVVENVKGAQPWVGRAQANYGSFYLWGDVRSVGGRIVAAHRVEFGAPMVKAKRQEKNGHLGGGSWFAIGSPGQTNTGKNPDGRKVPMNFHEHEKTGKPGRSFQSAAVEMCEDGRKVPVYSDPRRNGGKGTHLTSPRENFDGVKNGSDWFGSGENCSLQRRASSKSTSRKAASAQIAKIPFELAAHIARCFKPQQKEQVA